MLNPVPERRRWGRHVMCAGAGLAMVVVSVSRWGGEAPAVAAVKPQIGIVIAAGDLPAGQLVSAADVQVAWVDAVSAPPSAVADTSRVAGRRLLVPAHRGDPILLSMTGSTEALVAGRRLVRLRVSPDDVPERSVVGAPVEVVAALDAQTSSSGHAEERMIAVASVVSITAEQPQDGTAAPSSPASASGGSTPDVLVILECGSADALRVLWARDFARAIRLIGYPAGDHLANQAEGTPA